MSDFTDHLGMNWREISRKANENGISPATVYQRYIDGERDKEKLFCGRKINNFYYDRKLGAKEL